MKKLTVMAACAALLLGGGCFLKANQMNLSMLENLAYADGGNSEENSEENSGGIYCYWIQTGHAPDWSYIIVTCMGSYFDHTQPYSCDCAKQAQTEKWY